MFIINFKETYTFLCGFLGYELETLGVFYRDKHKTSLPLLLLTKKIGKHLVKLVQINIYLGQAKLLFVRLGRLGYISLG